MVIEGLREKIDALNINLTKLMTMFGNGPGTWPRCEVHAEKIDSVEKQLADIQKVVNGMLLKAAALCGGVAVVVFLANIFAPVIQHKLGITIK